MSAILDWKMTAQEAEVYSLAFFYETEFKKIFGKVMDGQLFRRNCLPQRSDPRKSNLFKYCWKLRRETRGLLELHEYKDYIRANLIILKLHKSHVEPLSICGDKAWIRYKVWKRHYDQKMSDVSAVSPSISGTNPKIIGEIDRTKKFIFEKCEGSPTVEKLDYFIKTGIFKFWVATGKISFYYVVLSPFVAKNADVVAIAKDCSFSVALIQERTTQEIKDYFKHEYRYEYY